MTQKGNTLGLKLGIFAFTGTAAAVSGIAAFRRGDLTDSMIALAATVLLALSGWVVARRAR